MKKNFFMVNPKSYLYGKNIFKLAKITDELAAKYDFDVYFTAPFVDLRMISENTKNIIVTAQHADEIYAGRGMGRIVVEGLYEAGVRAVFLNHAEHALTVSQLSKTIIRCKEVGLKTIVCADSVEEAKAIAMFSPDILLCEPTDLIGTGKVSGKEYVDITNKAIKDINPDILVMQAAGISKGEDVFNIILYGADGTGCTSGIVCAPSPEKMVEEMLVAMANALEY